MSNHSSAIPDSPTENFTAERWTELTQPLREYEFILRPLANEQRMDLLGSSRWPEIRLRRRSLMLVNEVRLSMVTEKADGHGPEWAVRIVRYARFPPLLAKRQSVAEVDRFTDHVLRNDTARVAGSVFTALRKIA